jgi:hypothetical protein
METLAQWCSLFAIVCLQVFAKRLSGRAQQQVIVPSTYGSGGLRAESLGTQERETLMTRIGLLSQERQALEVLLANSEKEKKTWSEICSSTLTSMKGLEAEIEREKQKREQSGDEAKKQCSEMQSQLLQLTDEKQKILMEKDSEHEALMAKVLELEKCKVFCFSQTFMTCSVCRAKLRYSGGPPLIHLLRIG